MKPQWPIIKADILELPPHHLIHHADVALDDAHHLCGNVFVDVVEHGDAGEAVADKGDGHVDALQQAFGVDAAQHEAALVEGLGALRGDEDTDCHSILLILVHHASTYSAYSSSCSAVSSGRGE